MVGVAIAIILGVIVGVVVIFAWRMGRERSGFELVITKFMKAGAARNMGAAYDCWSSHSATEENIAEFIESSYDVFAGYEGLTISDQGTKVGVGGITESDVSGAIIYTGGKRLPLKARLVKEKDVWKIIGIRIGSTALFLT
jgi:hypothetical protein